MELLLLVMSKAGPYALPIGVLYLFRNYLRFSFAFGKARTTEKA